MEPITENQRNYHHYRLRILYLLLFLILLSLLAFGYDAYKNDVKSQLSKLRSEIKTQLSLLDQGKANLKSNSFSDDINMEKGLRVAQTITTRDLLVENNLTVGGGSTLQNLTVFDYLEVLNGPVILPAGSINNIELLNSSLTYEAGSGLSGGGTVALGGTATFNIGAGRGIKVWDDDIEVIYGDQPHTAVEGNKEIIIVTNSNLTGGKNITLGNGGTFELGIVSNPTFSTSVTTPLLNLTNSGFNLSLQAATLTGNQTLTLPNTTGDICVSTGNCAGLGGTIAGAGTTNRIAKFTAANTIGDSSINDLGSAVAMTIDASGNVGIGTTAPGAKLQIHGTTGAGFEAARFTETGAGGAYISFERSSDSTRGMIIGEQYGATDNKSTIRSCGPVSEFVCIQPGINSTGGKGNILLNQLGGNLGVGTAAPVGLLQVAQVTTGQGTVATNGTTTLTGTGTQFLNTFKVGDTITVSGETVRTIATINSNTSLTTSVAFSTTASSLSYTLTGGNRLTVLGNGNVGIGTTAPGDKLDVANGHIVLSGTGSRLRRDVDDSNLSLLGATGKGTGAYLQVSGDTHATTPGWVEAITKGTGIFKISNAPLGSLSQTELLRVTSTGNVGIGTTAPTKTLEVASEQWGHIAMSDKTAGAGTVKSFLSMISVASSAYSEWGLNRNATTGVFGDTGKAHSAIYLNVANADSYIAFNTGSVNNTVASERMRIDKNGNVGIGTTGPTQLLTLSSTTAASNLLVEGNVSSNILLQQYSNGTDGPDYYLRKARGTIASPLNTQSGDQFGRFRGEGNFGGTWLEGARIQFGADTGTISGTSMPGFISMSTTPDGSVTPSERLRISSTGNVGIGTTAPNAKLQIVDSTSFPHILISDSATDSFNKNGWIGVPHYLNAEESFGIISGRVTSSTNVVRIGGSSSALNAATDIQFYTAANNTTTTGSLAMLINPAGNVGIGTLTPTSFKLEVAGNVGPEADNTRDLGSALRRWANIYGTNIIATTLTGTVTPSGFTEGSVAFAGTGGTLTQDNANFFWDDTSNRLGIGTTTPEYSLHVTGGDTLLNRDSASTAGNPLLILRNLDLTTNNYAQINFAGFDASSELDNAARIGTQFTARSATGISGALVFSTSNNAENPTERMRIDSLGNVGIGTTGPSSNLHVSQNSFVGGDLLKLSDSINTNGEYIGINFDAYSRSRQGRIAAFHESATSLGLKLYVDNTGTPVEAMTILGNGNVGIGITNPLAKLHTSSSDSIVARFQLPGSGAQTGNQAGIVLSQSDFPGNMHDYAGLFSEVELSNNLAEAGALVFKTSKTGALTEQMRITSTGNVGIGTTAPEMKLHIKDTVAFSLTSKTGTLFLEGEGTFGDGDYGGSLIFSRAAGLRRSAGIATVQKGADADVADLVFLTKASTATDDILSEKMRIAWDGNVGIGTVTPTTKLEISANDPVLKITDSDTTARSAILRFATGGGTWDISQTNNLNFIFGSDNRLTLGRLAGDIGAQITGASSATADLFRVNGSGVSTPYLNVSSGGNVGIGTTGPGAKLDVTGDVRVGTTLGINRQAAPGNIHTIASPVNDLVIGINGAANDFVINTVSGTTERFRIEGDTGNVGIGTTAPTSNLHLAVTVSDATSNIVTRIQPTLNTASSNFFSMYSNALYTGTGTLTTGISQYGLMNNNGTGTITNAQGIRGGVSNLSTGAIGSATSLYSNSVVNSGGGTVTNAYGLYLEAQTAGANNYGIYQIGTASNYFGGNVGIGDTGPSNTLKVVGSLCVSSATGACAGSTAGTIYATNTTVQAADLAENYISSQTLEPGDLVIPANDGNDLAVVRSTSKAQTQLIGVISTEPGVTLNSGAKTDSAHPNIYPIALSGRVPVKVNAENGPIQAGDMLTSSSTPGVAMKATAPGVIIGKALEPFVPTDSSGQAGKIMTFVGVSYGDPGRVLAGLTLDADGNLVVKKSTTGTTSTTSTTGSEGQADIADLSATDSARLDILSEKVDSNTSEIDILKSSILNLKSKTASLEAELLTLNFDLLTNKASGSAELGLENLDVNDVTITNSLSVGGRTTLSDVGVTGVMNIGLLAIDGLSENGFATLNTTSGPLMIQSDGLNGIDILAGKVTIESNGDMKVAGELTVKKLNVDTQDVASASLGEATLLSGEMKVKISSSSVTDKSKIFVTSKTKTDKPLSVTGQTDGKSFDVEINSADSKDIKFNWWIVN